MTRILKAPDGSRYFCEVAGGLQGRIWRQLRSERKPRAVKPIAERRRLLRLAKSARGQRAKRFKEAAVRVALGCDSEPPPVIPQPDTEQPSPGEPAPINPTATATATPTATSTPTITPTSTATPTPLNFTSSVEDNGITFQFDGSYAYGTFITGEYWVVGPVTITSISPAATGTRNGFEVSPISPTAQGFDDRANGFQQSRIPNLPLSVQPGYSVIKAVSRENPSHAKLQRAAILTVVSEPPPADAFRPGYAVPNEPIYRLSQLKLEKLPSISFTGTRPPLSQTAQRFQRPWIDHLSNWAGRSIHPFEHMPDYGAALTIHTNEAALRLLLDDPLIERRDAMVGYLQYGIDLRSMLRAGTRFPANGGHCQGRVVPLAFAAVLLDNSYFSDGLAELLAETHEPKSIVIGQEGRALFGQPGTGGEYSYWRNQLADVDSRTIPDPYGYIDGGKTPGGFYDYCCNAQSFKGVTLNFHLFPEMKQYFDDPALFEYSKRWVNFGGWTQPDPCAPVDARDIAACAEIPNKYQCQLTYYGITYGPDGNGGCIHDTDMSDGVGRFPNLHGSNQNGGSYGSSLVNSVWTAHPPP